MGDAGSVSWLLILWFLSKFLHLPKTAWVLLVVINKKGGDGCLLPKKWEHALSTLKVSCSLVIMGLLVLVCSRQDLRLRHREAHEAIVLNDDRSFHNLKCGYKMNIFHFIFFLHKDAIASPVFFAFYSNFIYFFLSPLVPFIFFPSFFYHLFVLIPLLFWPFLLFFVYSLKQDLLHPMAQADLEPVTNLPQPPE